MRNETTQHLTPPKDENYSCGQPLIKGSAHRRIADGTADERVCVCACARAAFSTRFSAAAYYIL